MEADKRAAQAAAPATPAVAWGEGDAAVSTGAHARRRVRVNDRPAIRQYEVPEGSTLLPYREDEAASARPAPTRAVQASQEDIQTSMAWSCHCANVLCAELGMIGIGSVFLWLPYCAYIFHPTAQMPDPEGDQSYDYMPMCIDWGHGEECDKSEALRLAKADGLRHFHFGQTPPILQKHSLPAVPASSKPKRWAFLEYCCSPTSYLSST